MFSMRDVTPGATISEVFYHVNSSVGQGDFTVTLFRNGVKDSSVGYTISEVETNFYKIDFTIDAGEDVYWELDVYETANPTDGRYQGTYRSRVGVPANVVQANGVAYTDSAELSYIKTFVENIYAAIQRLLGGLI